MAFILLLVVSASLASANAICKCGNGDADPPSKKVSGIRVACILVAGRSGWSRNPSSTNITSAHGDWTAIVWDTEMRTSLSSSLINLK